IVANSGEKNGVQFEPFGTQLTFLPIVMGKGKIHLEVLPSITSLDPEFGTILTGSSIPGPRKTVVLESGQTLVVGGINWRSAPEVPEWVKSLQELPLVGLLLGPSSPPMQGQMYTLVTPHVVDPTDGDQLPQALLDQENGTREEKPETKVAACKS